jgi:hypothetical protein
MKSYSGSSFLLLVLLLVGSMTSVVAQSAVPLPTETLPAGGNPDVTPLPESQVGTLGPTADVLTQSMGSTAAPAPTQGPVPSPAPTMKSGGVIMEPPSIQMAVVGMAGVAAALL